MSCVLAALDDVVRRQPDAVALEEAGAGALTYGQLAAAAERVAGRLADAGVRCGDTVVLAAPRSTAWVVGAWACWMRGAAFCPLPPTLPAARSRSLAARIRARAALVAEGCEPAPDALPRDVLRLAVDASTAPEAPHCTARAQLVAVAYVIFTSGSSGVPKGVRVLHRGLVPMLTAQIEAFGIGPGARCLWALAPEFDASISDVGAALLGGATLVIDARVDLRDPATLLARLHRARVTHADLPPALLPYLDPRDAPPALETIVVGGEPVHPAAARAWSRRVNLVNVYGPTEATVCTSLMRCSEHWDAPLLGNPLPHVEYRLEDGELVIVGDAVAAGYLDDPALTDLRFCMRDGRPAYRTGDRVARRADGAWVFQGRVDRQVKIAGQLVAPEEIEACLRAAPGVVRCAVAPSEAGDRIVAFVEATPDTEVSSLQRHAEHRLARHLVPNAIHVVERLPALTSGKVDLASLAARGVTARTTPRATPRAEEERAERKTPALGILLDCVADALALDRSDVRASETFLEHGGTSLGAIDVAARAQAAGLRIDAASLLRHVSIASLIERAEIESQSASSVAELAADADALIARAIGARTAVRRAGTAPAGILLTGATGLLGAHVLAELLRRDVGPVTCLVRARSESHAQARLREVLDREGFEAEVALAHVRAVPADLRAADIGLVPERDAAARELAHRHDRVVHLAGLVDGSASDETLRAVNAGGTAAMLGLAVSAGAHVVHASTLSIFCGAKPRSAMWTASDLPPAEARLPNAYDRSKLLAELVLRRASEDLPSARIVRYGLLQGTRGEGWLDRVMRGLVRVGALPGDLPPETSFDVTPVEHAARATVDVVLADGRGLAVHHVAAERPLAVPDLACALAGAGAALELVSAGAFAARAQETMRAERSPDAAAALLALSRAFGAPAHARHVAFDLFESTGLHFASDAPVARADALLRLAETAQRAVRDVRTRGGQP